MEFRSPCSLASPNFSAAATYCPEPFDNAQRERNSGEPDQYKKSETLHLTLACQYVHLHCSQRLNDIQARCSNRR
jgi:hypothetical protein